MAKYERNTEITTIEYSEKDGFKDRNTTIKTTGKTSSNKFGLFSFLFNRARDKKGFGGNIFFMFFLVVFFLLLFANVYQMIFDTGDGEPRTLASLLRYFEQLQEADILKMFTSIDITIAADWGVFEWFRSFLNNFLLGPLQVLLVFVQGVFQLIAYVLGFLGWLIS